MFVCVCMKFNAVGISIRLSLSLSPSLIRFGAMKYCTIATLLLLLMSLLLYVLYCFNTFVFFILSLSLSNDKEMSHTNTQRRVTLKCRTPLIQPVCLLRFYSLLLLLLCSLVNNNKSGNSNKHTHVCVVLLLSLPLLLYPVYVCIAQYILLILYTMEQMC